MTPWSETVRLGKAGACNQQTLRQGWAYHQARWLPRASSPGSAEGCGGSLQPTHPGFLCLGGHLGMNTGSKKDPRAPQDKHNGETLFFCGGVPGGGPKAIGQKWSFERILRWRRALSSHPITAPELFPAVWHSEARLIPNQSLCKIWFVLALEVRILRCLLACLSFSLPFLSVHRP